MSSITQNSFLVYNDFKFQIKNDDLLAILGETGLISNSLTNPATIDPQMEWNNLSQYTQLLLLQAQNAAVEEISSYIRNRYYTSQIFAPTQIWNSGTTYFGNSLVYYNAPIYNTGTTYQIGQQFSFSGIVYSATSLISGATDPTPNSAYVTEQDALYYANLPVAQFSENNAYFVGNLVWWMNQIYICIGNTYPITPALSQNLELRYGLPSAQQWLGFFNMDVAIQPNTVPGAVVYNFANNYWKLYTGQAGFFNGSSNSVYSFSAINPTQNTTYWTKGDNRNPQILMYSIDILLYHLHARINPRNIPDLRRLRYDGGEQKMGQGGAIGWLRAIQSGKVNLNAPEIQPTQGGDIRFGSYPKNNQFF